MSSVLVSLAVASDDLTTARAQALLGLAIAIAAVIIGARALRSRRRNHGLTGLALGLVGAALSGLHLATATGPIGSGSGKLGAIVALVVGLFAASLGAFALARSEAR